MQKMTSEIVNEVEIRKSLGDKKFHSDMSLQNVSGNEDTIIELRQDPGVQNSSMLTVDGIPVRRRTMSQPGPISGNIQTALAMRAKRRQLRSVAYAEDIPEKHNTDKLNKLTVAIRDDFSLPPTPGSERNSPSPYIYNNRNGDVKSLSNYRLQVTDVRGSTPRKRSVVTMDAQSIRSMETQAPPPTSPEDNARLSSKYMALILSSMYAILLVTLGAIIYPSEPFVDLESPSLIYSLCLLGIGFIFQVYLLFDINRYKAIAMKNQKIKGMHMEKFAEFFKKQEDEFGNETGNRSPDVNRNSDIPSPMLMPLSHDYCFSSGRHSGSFYLKVGAAGFALGHLVHSVLLIAVQVGYIIDESVSNDECVSYLQVALDVLQPLYCFLQLYFIFKYCNVLILKGQGIAYFGFMHMIGSSLCFWVFNIVRETLLALTIYAAKKYGNETVEEEQPPQNIDLYFNIRDLYNENCTGSQVMSTVISNLSPYLYPFGVEFNILIVAVYYIIWSNIGNCENVDAADGSSCFDDTQTICKIPTAHEDNDYTSNVVIYADCHASNKGLFLGLILTVIVIGNLILGFVLGNLGDDYAMIGYTIGNWVKLVIHTIMLLAVVVAFNQLRKLDINEHPISLLDDILLFVCLPAFFMETSLSLMATVNMENIVRSIDFVLMVIQVVLQTLLLVDGLRRCSNTRKLRRNKPGREILMFLLIANVSMWIIYTFSYKSPDSLDERYKFFGKEVWSILGHISLPLMMFYRFHSSVCFADIWDAAYKPGSEH